ncbi:DNA repair protein RadC [Sphingomonas sp. RIT328]|nr:DNA repair protein RadC [Sphingomonas sp. RIT328]
MEEFGSAAAVLGSAGGLRLRRCVGDPGLAEMLTLVADFLRCVLGGRVRGLCVLSGRDAVFDYLRAEMAFCRRETLRVLYLDAAHRLLADEVAAHGTVDSVSFYAREIVVRALELGAVGLVLAHNHPSGSPVATPADVTATDALIRACTPLGIVVLDHLVVAEHGTRSLRETGWRS